MLHDSVTVSAPGKIHLIGEHSVVYGFPALIAAVNRRLSVEIRKKKSGIRNEKAVFTIINITGETLRKALMLVDLFKVKTGYAVSPCEISVYSSIPEGSGMGSSAAFSAAFMGALLMFSRKIWNPERINALSYEAEKIFHGTPSGADNTTVVFGGLVWFRRELDFLKSIWTLPTSSYHFPQFSLINTGKPSESTKEMVEAVKYGYLKNRRKYDLLFLDQERNAKKILLALKTGDIRLLGDAIRNAQKNLEKIGIVGRYAKNLIREVEEYGGVAKVCGAGGVKGGSGIILCFHENPTRLKDLEKKFNIKIEKITFGEEGIRLEKK